MTNVNANEARLPDSNGDSEVARLTALVESLRNECDGLRQALARAEEERSLYLKAVYELMRPSLKSEEVDFAELERTTAGPVELLE